MPGGPNFSRSSSIEGLCVDPRYSSGMVFARSRPQGREVIVSRSRVNYDAQYVFQTGHAPYQESPNKTSFSRVAGIGSDSGQSSLWRLGIDIDGPREVPLQARHVERLLPFCDDDRRDAVADQI